MGWGWWVLVAVDIRQVRGVVVGRVEGDAVPAPLGADWKQWLSPLQTPPLRCLPWRLTPFPAPPQSCPVRPTSCLHACMPACLPAC